MNKTAVVYQSKYGSTKKYAQWLAEELGCDIFERKNIKAEQLADYDTIIYGGGLYAGGVSGIDLIVKAYDKLKDKNLIPFTCGLADPNDAENTNNIRTGLNKVLTAQMQSKINIFHLRGGIDYTRLTIAHKSMMAMLHKMTAKKDCESLREEDKQMLETYGKVVDFTDKQAIEPIIAFIREL